MNPTRGTLYDARLLAGAGVLGAGLAALTRTLGGTEVGGAAPAAPLLLPFLLAALTGVAKTTTP